MLTKIPKDYTEWKRNRPSKHCLDARVSFGSQILVYSDFKKHNVLKFEFTLLTKSKHFVKPYKGR